MKTYLVTGAAGFVGAALATFLIKNGNKVVTVDNLSTGFESSIPDGVVFYKGNVQDKSLIEQLEKYTFDCIFHIAGQSSGEISYDDPVYDLQTNTQSTLLLLKLAKKVHCRKFIYASSMSVYGDFLNGSVNEEVKLFPKSFYGIGKMASENYLRIYEEHEISCTSLRLCNIYGPGQNLSNMRQGMVSIFVKQALSDNKIVVKGSKDRFRDFIYIDDVVRGFYELEKRNTTTYECYNLTSNEKTTVGELTSIIKDVVGNNTKILFDGSTPGDQFGVYGDNSKVLRETNWKITINLREGLSKMIFWAKDNINV
jgi:UDP-glucose 4-epimerase